MALVKGTNCGFVTEAPVDDPTETLTTIDYWAKALKDVTPANVNRVTEIGWWCDNATEECNFEVAIYDHNVGDDNPEAVVGWDQTNAKGTDAGWKRATGLNIPITAETIYWIAIQVDNVPTSTYTNYKEDVGEKSDRKELRSALTDPWGTSDSTRTNLNAFYALVEEAPPGINMQINIGDVWKDAELIKINIGDTWKEVAEIKQNIGDVWKTVF